MSHFGDTSAILVEAQVDFSVLSPSFPGQRTHSDVIIIIIVALSILEALMNRNIEDVSPSQHVS